LSAKTLTANLLLWAGEMEGNEATDVISVCVAKNKKSFPNGVLSHAEKTV